MNREALQFNSFMKFLNLDDRLTWLVLTIVFTMALVYSATFSYVLPFFFGVLIFISLLKLEEMGNEDDD